MTPTNPLCRTAVERAIGGGLCNIHNVDENVANFIAVPR